MTTPVPDLVRHAAELVLHYDKTLSQTARILQCTIPAVQKYVQQYLDQQSEDAESSSSSEAEGAFLSVRLADEPIAKEPISIPLDILTPKGWTLRLQLTSLQDIITLLQSLEVEPC